MPVSEILSALIGAIVGHWLISSYDSHNRRREFRGFIRTHLERFELVDWKSLASGELLKLHQDSVAVIADESARIVDDISKSRCAQFNAARTAYRSLKRQDVEPCEYYDPTAAETNVFPEYLKGLERITGLLNEMIKYAR